MFPLIVPHEKLDKVASIPWVKSNVKDKEVRDFFVGVLQAEVEKRMRCDVCKEDIALDIKAYVEVHFWILSEVGYKLDNHIYHPDCFKEWVLSEGNFK